MGKFRIFLMKKMNKEYTMDEAVKKAYDDFHRRKELIAEARKRTEKIQRVGREIKEMAMNLLKKEENENAHDNERTS